MSGFTTVLARELRERWTVLAVAAVAAVIPVLAPWLPGVSGGGDTRAITGWFVAISIAGGFGLLLGASALTRDLVEGRIGFYFARPLGGLEIWGGKILAAVLLTVAAAILPLGTAFSLQALLGRTTGGGWAFGLAIVIDLAVIAVALGHAAGVIVRTRSRWQLLDFVGLVTVAAGVWWSLATLGRTWAGNAFWIVIGILLTVVPASLLLAGAVQTAGGRSDPVRGHRLLSLTLWSVLVVFTAALMTGAHWVVTPGPMDLTTVQVTTPPNGSWLAVTGTSWGRGDLLSTFLLDTASDRWLRLPSQPWEPGFGTIAQDGHRALWAVPAAGRRHNLQQVVAVNLDSARLQPQPTSITLLQEWHATLAIDPPGNRIAIVGGGTVSVSALPEVRLLVAARLPATLEPRGVFFLSPGVVRIYGWIGTNGAQGKLWIGELDVATRRLATTGSIPGVARLHWEARLDSLGEHMVLLRKDTFRAPSSVDLYDAHSGVKQADLTRPGWQPIGGATFLADGSVAIAEQNGRDRRLRVVAQDGGEFTATLPPLPGMCRIGLEAAPGTVLVGIGPTELLWHKWRTLAVTPGKAGVREIGRGRPEPDSLMPRVVRTPRPGSVATRLLTTGSKLELLDPSLATTRVVAGRS